MSGKITIRLSKLWARMDNGGEFAARIFINGTDNYCATAGRKLSDTNNVVDWLDSSGQGLTITLDPGIYALEIKIYNYTRMYPRGQLYGTATLEPADLVPGSQATLSVESIPLITRQSHSIGSLRIDTAPLPCAFEVPTDITDSEFCRAPILGVLMVVLEGLTSMKEKLPKSDTLDMLYQLSLAILKYLHHETRMLDTLPLTTRRYESPNPVEDTLRLAGDQIGYLTKLFDKIDHQSWTSFALQLNGRLARSFIIIYGFVDVFSGGTYRTIHDMNFQAFQELERTQFEVITLQARMMDARSPGILDNLPASTSRDSFMRSLALKSVKYSISGGAQEQFSGPYIDIILSLKGALIVQLLDLWKENLDYRYTSAGDVTLRSGARWLMTFLAQHTHKLPSALELSSSLTFEDKAHTEGTMRDPGLQDIGGFAEITTARMYDLGTETDNIVAIKTIKGNFGEDEHQKLYREIIASWTLRHPRLLPVLGITYATEHERLSIVSPYMDNRSLESYIHRVRDRHTEDQFRTWLNIRLKDIAEGLVYLHGEHMVHGDMRAANILVDRHENIYIADFGLTVYAESRSKALMSTRAGSPRWTAPEIAVDQQVGGRSVRPTYASDVYSFGMVCFELYTQDIPWGRGTTETVREQRVANGQHPSRPTLLTNDELWAAVVRCCSTNPQLRGTAQQLFEDLRRIVPVDPIAPPLQLRRRRRGVA